MFTAFLQTIVDTVDERLVICLYTVFMFGFLPIMETFLKWNESRPNRVIIQDPILSRLATYDTSNIVTMCTFVSHVHAIQCLLYAKHREWQIIQLLTVYIGVTSLRILFMYVCPLQVHPKSIPLDDKIIQSFLHTHTPFNHDLMFSGHIAQQVILLLFFPSYILWCTIILSILGILFSKVHYCIDMLVSPFVTFTVYHIVTHHLIPD